MDGLARLGVGDATGAANPDKFFAHSGICSGRVEAERWENLLEYDMIEQLCETPSSSDMHTVAISYNLIIYQLAEWHAA